MPNVGYASVDKQGKVFVETVSPHKRGAMVNALYSVFRVGVTAAATEEQITEAYLRSAKNSGHRIVRVHVNIWEEE